MSDLSSLRQNNIKLLYYRYKDSLYYQLLIIISVVVICIILFFRIVFPQIEQWFSIRNEIIAARERITTINNNVVFIQNLNRDQVQNQFDVATSAVPFEKDFGSIVDALTDTSLNTGVALDDYTFQVGDIASSSGKKETANKNGLSTVAVTVTVSGGFEGLTFFLEEISKKLPLSDVIDINGDENATVIRLQFYQKDFPNIVFKDDVALVALPEKDESLLNEFDTWRSVPQGVPVSSGSAVSLPLF